MKKLLVRSGMLPEDSYNEFDLLDRDRFGSNNGNLVYQFSIIRTLMTEDAEITSDEYATNPNRAKKINQKYDAYIIPLADAFRESFIPHLKRYTELIKQLKIPVIVIGVGLKAPYNYDVKKGFKFDKEVKDFVSAVLEKSNIIGLRGQITADYLTYLGFIPEKDFTVIGCPSMYAFGRELNLKQVELQENSLISINASNIATEKTMTFLNEVAVKHPNYYFVPQSYKEFLLNYFGFGSIENVVHNFPKNLGSKFYSDGKVKFFLNTTTWFKFMKKASLSIGTRLHGNIVATINGTPSITIVHDARMRELAEYHALPSITPNDLEKYNSLNSLIRDIDFTKVESNHPERFDHFIDFLDQNNLDHIYKNDESFRSAPLDNKMKLTNFDLPIKTINAISDEEKVIRLTKGFEIYKKRSERMKNNKINQLKQEINMLKKQVNTNEN